MDLRDEALGKPIDFTNQNTNMRSLNKVLNNIGQSYKNHKGVLTTTKNDRTYQNFEKFNLPKLAITLSGQKMVDISSVIQALQQLYAEQKISLTVEAVHYNFILEEGVLQVPIKVKIGNHHYCLFLIYNEACAAAFTDARNRLKVLKKYQAIYLSKIPMTKIRAPHSALTSLRFDHFRLTSQTPKLENYATWWTTTKEPLFQHSASFRDLAQIFKTLDGYESYFIGRFFKALEVSGFTGETVKRVGLPKKERTLTVIGPEEQMILLSFSQKKGIRLHFDRYATPFGYRAAIIEQLCIAIQAYTVRLQLRDLPRDTTTRSRGMEWCIEMAKKNKEVIGSF